jgi:hypothetical protein
VADAAVGDHRDAGGARDARDVRDRGDLGHADARDDARGADRSGADADLDAVAPAATRSFAASAVAMLPAMIGLGMPRFLSSRTVSMTFFEWPWAVSTTRTSTSASTSSWARLKSFTPMAAPTRRRPRAVLGGERVLRRLVDVLHRDEALQVEVPVDEQQLLDLALVEDVLRASMEVPGGAVASGGLVMMSDSRRTRRSGSAGRGS